MYKLFKYVQLINDTAFIWEEVCISNNINYISQLAEGITRVDGKGRYRYNIGDMMFEVVRLGNSKYKHVKISDCKNLIKKEVLLVNVRQRVQHLTERLNKEDISYSQIRQQVGQIEYELTSLSEEIYWGLIDVIESGKSLDEHIEIIERRIVNVRNKLLSQ
ncbi:hypothetical protein A616_17150 [Brevibacillus brevis X23]|nr:hypothetical protein A616_17150 [Brevibacillus brevis X23]